MQGPKRKATSKGRSKARKRGFTHAASLVQGQIRTVSEARGFAVSKLITHWAEIVGSDLAKLCRPVRAHYGRGTFGATLTVLAPGAAAPILQARLPELQDRVNGCYGYAAISRIKITQTAPEGFAEPKTEFQHSAPRPQRPPDPQMQAQLNQVQDPGLRDALARLSEHLPNP